MTWLNKHWFKWTSTLAVLFILTWVLVHQEGMSKEEIFLSLSRFGLKTLCFSVVLVGLQNFFMALRIWALFPKTQRISLGAALHGVFYGQTLNTFVPARAGDVLKAVIFSKTGSPHVTIAAGVIVADKVIDLLALIILVFGSGSFLLMQQHWSFPVSMTTVSFVFLSALSLLALISIFFRTYRTKIIDWWQGFKEGLSGVLDWKKACLALGIGIAAWTCEALTFQFLCEAQDFALSLSQSVFLLLMLNLAIAVPISVANLGLFEAALVFGLGKLGASNTMAIAVAATHHTLQMATLLLLTALVAIMIRKN